MPDSSRQRDHDSRTEGRIPGPETVATNQRHPRSDQTLRQQKGDLYIIHDMATKRQRIDSNAAAVGEQDIMKILDNLVNKTSTHHPSTASNRDTASSDITREILLNGDENDQPQNESFAMRRWKSLPFEARPWHCAELLSATARGGTNNHNRAGTEGNGLNKNDHGAVDGDGEVGSNKASAGSEVKGMDEKLAEALAN
jgi:hypothetical protein